jgi:amino acid adenylation domain-containing protein
MQSTATETTPRVRIFDRATLEAREFWTRRLDREVEPAAPPPDFVPGADRPGEEAVELELAGAAFQTLSRVTRGSAFLVHAALCAALAVCLYRHRAARGPAEIAISTPPRLGEGEPPAPGLVPVVHAVDGEASFRETLAGMRQALLDAYTHQGYPFARAMDDLRVADAGRRAAFHSVILATEGVSGALPAEVQADLHLEVRPMEDRVRVRIRFHAGRYRRGTVAAFAGQLAALVENLLADPAAPLAGVPMMDGAGRRWAVHALNDTARPLPAAGVPALFAEQAARAPAAPAVVHGGETLTYAELDARAARLAAWLRARGVGDEARVGVHLERGAPMIAALLAVLRAGGAYLPLDPAAPPERIREILDDAGARLVLTQRDRAGALPAGVQAVALDDPAFAAELAALPEDGPVAPAAPDALAYVVYTSGSTGRPKGVAVPHRGIVRLVRGTDYLPFGPGERIAQLSSAAFDAATFEIWGALLNGGCVVVVDRDVSLAPAALGEALRAHGVTALFLTTALFNRVAREAPEAFGTLRHLLFGGEAVDPGAVDRVLRAGGPRRLLHVYGPTESTTFAAWHPVQRVEAGAATVPIGLPIANTTLYVLDGRMEPVPAGVPGELYLGSAGLARGYLGRPALTAERFVPHPHGGAGERLYRTGDRVRRGGDGAVEFLGRFDFQVKVRGFRIEPGEIEAALLREPGVREAVVVVREDGGEKRLVAYVVADAEAAAPAELRAVLGARLPAYMVPSALVALPALPLNASGKVDRAALPDPAPEAAGHTAPRTPTEEIVAEVWAGVLRLPRVGADDDFFALGGHSLLAMQVIARVRELFGVEVPLRALFEAPTVAALAAQVEALRRGGGPAGPPPLRRAERRGPAPLSFAQQRLWLVDRMEPGSAAYNVPAAVRLRGALDADALERALAELARRHEMLRTRFPQAEGAPVQVVDAPAPVPLARADLGAAPPAEREARARRLAEEEALRPFDLARGPLVRAVLVRLDDDDHVLLLTLHHVVTDGWSMEVVVRELSALYAAFRQGLPSPLPELPVQYADFAAWQREWLRGEVLERQLAWWRERLEGAPPVLGVPTDRPRTPRPDPRSGRRYFLLSREASEALRQAGRREGATLFMVLLAAWQALLARYAGAADVVVGTPIAGRTRVELEGLIGFFVNMLPLRTNLSGDPSFRALLARVRETTLDAWQHQDLPFERLVEEVAPGSLAHSPVFQASFALRRPTDPAQGLGGVAMEEFGSGTGIAKFDLDLTVRDGERLLCVLQYRASLFDDATAERMAGHLERLLQAAAADPDQPLSALPLMDDAERARVLEEWPGTDAPAPGLPVHALFARQAARTPEAEAVRFGGRGMTYAEVEGAAGRLARRLAAAGVRPGDRVGVEAVRSAHVVPALLAVLQAGAAYVPLDPGDPPARLAGIMEDTGIRALLVHGEVPASLAAFRGPVLRMDPAEGADAPDAPLPAAVDPGAEAYVMFTSGSTGRPKGVSVPHRAVVRLVTDTDFIDLGPDQVFLQLAPLAFDASTLEVWGPLLNGARLVVHPPHAPSLAELAAALREEGITTLWLTAGLFHSLVDAEPESLSGLRQLLAGGDVLSVPHVRRVLEAHPRLRLVNGYGPTENTTFTCCHTVAPTDVERGAIPLGRPIAGTRVYVVDEGLRPCPVGVPGELLAAGHGLALGYVGRDALAAEKFIHLRMGRREERAYRTGDRARWLADGTVEFLGRVDEQVKVRGFRVEPGEVEAVLRGLPGVRDAVVAARGDGRGERRVVAWVVGDGAPSPAALREQLAGRLPGYMLPAAIVPLDAFPLTRNGKVDRRVLPEPDPAEGDGGDTPPSTPTEVLMAEIWREVLELPEGAPLGVHANFFELGGHSLLATQVIARLRRSTGVELPLRALFEAPTIGGFAATVESHLLEGLSDDELMAHLQALEPAG